MMMSRPLFSYLMYTLVLLRIMPTRKNGVAAGDSFLFAGFTVGFFINKAQIIIMKKHNSTADLEFTKTICFEHTSTNATVYIEVLAHSFFSETSLSLEEPCTSKTKYVLTQKMLQ